MPEILSIAVVGCGAVGRSHARAAARTAGVRLTAVVDLSEQARMPLAQEFGAAPFASVEDLLASGTAVDAAVVALPDRLHAPVSLQFLDAGCHVLLEKPMAASVAECEAVTSRAQGRGKVLMIGHAHHFIAAVVRARELMREGKVGVPLSARDTLPYTHYLPGRQRWFFDPKLAAGGALWANGVHQIDRLRWILDTTEAEAWGTVLAPSDNPSIEHTALWTTRYASGCVAQFFCGGMSAKGVFSGVEIFGSEGILRQETFGKLFVERGGEVEEVPLTPPEGGHIGAEMRAFVDAIRAGGPSPIPGEWGTAVIRVVEAVARSSREGGPVRVI